MSSATTSDEVFNPYAFLRSAAGEGEALRFLARKAFEIAAVDDDLFGIVEALLLARLAYASSKSMTDAGLLLSMLAYADDMSERQNEPEARMNWQAEALALLAIVSDTGESDALPVDTGTALVEMVERSTPEVTARAQKIRKLMTEIA